MRDLRQPGEVSAFPTDKFDPTCGGAYFRLNLYVAFSDSNRKLVVRSTATSVGEVPDVSLFYFPAMTVFNDKLYVAFLSNDSSSQLYYMTYDGENWSSPQVIPGVLTDFSPAMAVWDSGGGSKLYLAHSGSEKTGTQGTLWYTTFDGTHWATDTQVQDVSMKNSPAMAFHNWLCLGFQNSNGALCWKRFDGVEWFWNNNEIPGVSMSGSPSMAASDGQMFLAYSNTYDPDSNGEILQIDNEGDGWGQPYVLLPGGNPIYPGSSPTLVAGQDGSDTFVQLVYSDSNGEPVYQT